MPGRSRWLSGAAGALAIVTLVAAAMAMHRDAAFWNWSALVTGVRQQPGSALAASLGFTLASFAVLGAYDALGCAWVAPGRVRLATALFAGAAGNAVSNTLGFHAFTGTAVRLRLYRRAGIALGDALRVVSLSWLGIALGFVALIALAGLVGARLGLGGRVPAVSTSVGLAFALAAFLGWLSSSGRTLRLGAARLELPSARGALALIALGAIENGAAIAALHVLLPAASAPPFLPFALSYVCAVALGVASQVPGGLGVFEAALMAIWAGRIGAELPIALVVYRLVYNLLPFALSVLSLAAWELVHAGNGGRGVNSKAGSDGSATAA
jgi:uncharacterized membrane protein YbhN (UPF0104 family)